MQLTFKDRVFVGGIAHVRVHRIRLSSRALLGRTAESPLVFRDRTVSREHAELRCDEAGRLWLRDLCSMTGTRIDGVRIDRRAGVQLREDMQVTLGYAPTLTLIQVELAPAAAAADGLAVVDSPSRPPSEGHLSGPYVVAAR